MTISFNPSYIRGNISDVRAPVIKEINIYQAAGKKAAWIG